MTVEHVLAQKTARAAACLPAWALSFLLGAATIVGCADDPVVPPTGSTIHGTVEDSNGQPAPGVVIVVGGRPAVTSAADGSFHVDGVGSLYDVSVIQDSTNASVYMGLTRRDLRFFVSKGSVSRLATISGTVPPAPGKKTLIVFTPSDFVARSMADTNTGFFGMNVVWSSLEATRAGTLYVLRWTDDIEGRPAEYDAFGRRDLLLTDQAELVNQDFTELDFTDPPEAEISGSITIPTGHELESVTTFMRVGPGSVRLFTQSGVSAPFSTFDYVVPSIPGATFQLQGFATFGGFSRSHIMLYRNGIVPPATNLVLAMPEAHEIVEPAQGAADIDYSTVFQWTEGGRTGVYVVLMSIGTRQFTIALGGTSTRIPDLNAYGLGLPAGAAGHWHVYKLFPFSSMDELVGNEDWRTLEPESGDIHTEVRDFTMRP